jgi:hypothetical protein
VTPSTRRLAAIATGCALAAGFIAGRLSVPPVAVEVRRSEIEPYIEVWRAGELAAEWEPADGDVFVILDQVLRDDPALYRETQPADPSGPEPPRDPGRGRGPLLQQARR